MSTLIAKIQLRKDTSANWTSGNPVLLGGEIAITTDVFYTGTDQPKFKIGDGTQTWTQLDYMPIGSSATTWGSITGTLSAQTDLQTELNNKFNKGIVPEVYQVGDILYASGVTTVGRLAAAASNNVLLSSGTTTAPGWGKVDLTRHIVQPALGSGGVALQSSLTTYTSVWTSGGVAPTIGNGTITAQYIENGTEVTVFISVVPGSTTTFGNNSNRWTFSLPFNANSNLPVLPTAGGNIVGQAHGFISGVAHYTGGVILESSSTVSIFTSGQVNGWKSDLPNTWATTSRFSLSFKYVK